MGQIIGAGGTPNINIWTKEEINTEKEVKKENKENIQSLKHLEANWGGKNELQKEISRASKGISRPKDKPAYQEIHPYII